MGEPGAVEVQGQGQATVVVFPEHYFEHTDLKLENSKSTTSIDQVGAKKLNKKANTPKEYVVELQTDLIALKYLKAAKVSGVYGAETARAVLRFQRHAARVYRMPGPADVDKAKVFTGAANGVCDHATATEVRKWIDAKFVNPVGRFKLRKLNVAGVLAKHTMRSDAADEWEAIVKLVGDAGGIVTAEANGYGDTSRPLQKKEGKKKKKGTSSFSFHHSGRAVDIDQGFVQKGRYFIQKEVIGTSTFWRIFCKTDKQDGTQGTKIEKAAFKCFSFFNEKEFDIKAGFYIDMTQMIESRNTFERIKAQSGFDDTVNVEKDARYNKTEWWHFQYTVDKQATFLDEVELAGFTEDDAIKGGWDTDAELDHPPG